MKKKTTMHNTFKIAVFAKATVTGNEQIPTVRIIDNHLVINNDYCDLRTVKERYNPVRKFTKSKAIFPTDDSIRKVVFLSVREISKKWTMAAQNWGIAYSQIMIFFADRLTSCATRGRCA